MEAPPQSRGAEQRHWDEQRIHHFSGRGGDCRKLGRDLWHACSTRFHRFDPDHARRDPEKDLRLANRLLGFLRNEWMELRHDACGNESGYRYHWRWKPLFDEVV